MEQKKQFVTFTCDDIFSGQKSPAHIKQESKSNVFDLFGDVDDIEDDLTPQPYLNEYGKKIKANLDENVNGFVIGCNLKSKSLNNNWKAKTENDESLNMVQVDLFSGLRILKPLVSSEDMKQRMQGRKMIQLSKIGYHINKNNQDIDGDWVTIGIIVDKLPPKTSKNGQLYSIWKLNDLKQTDLMVFLFLFGESHTYHWKLNKGTVIGLLNSKILSNSSKKKTFISISIDTPGKLLVIGMSKDFGLCKAIKKNGEICNNIVNLQESKFCLYHISLEYKKVSAMRPEIQINFNGFQPKNTLMEKILNSTLIPKKNSNPKHLSEEEKVKRLKILNQFRERKELEVKELANKLDMPFTLAAKNLVKANETLQKSKINTFGQSSESWKPSEIFQSFSTCDSATQHVSQSQSSLSPKNIKTFPILARGFQFGDTIELGCKTKLNNSKAKALELLKYKPIIKRDPNQIKKKPLLDKVLQKVESNLENSENILNEAINKRKQKTEEERENKKRKLAAIDALLNKKSKHENEGMAAENEAEIKYFNFLERKEKIEEKMADTTEIVCKVAYCKCCKYMAQTPSQLCLDKKHNLIWKQAKKKFFKCKVCQKSTYIFDAIIPDKSCSKCGNSSWEKTSIYRIKKGPKLSTEKLLIRGEEVSKFLNSLK